jgi:hypothetical protein
MLQAPRHHRLVAEAAEELLVVLEAAAHQLDGADLAEGEVARAVHGGHASRP